AARDGLRTRVGWSREHERSPWQAVAAGAAHERGNVGRAPLHARRTPALADGYALPRWGAALPRVDARRTPSPERDRDPGSRRRTGASLDGRRMELGHRHPAH